MSDPRDVLRGWIEAEAAAVAPPDDARARGWDRLTAALAAGAAPRPELLASPRAWWPWLLVAAVLTALVAAALAWPSAPPTPKPPTHIVETDEPAPGPAPVIPLAAPAPPPTPKPPAPIVETDEPAPGPAPVIPLAAPAVDPPPAPTATRRPKPPPTQPVPQDSFAAELAILAEAQAALRDGATPRALRALARHARDYPAGQFAHDREALRALALCTGGRLREGAALARRFLAAHADSIHADRVRDACLP